MADTGERKKGETLAHGTSEVGVDAVLNSISDTILQMVLFQVEAKENESSLVRLDVAPLLSSIKFLVDLARRKAERWTDAGEKRNKDMMLKACGTMAEATSRVDVGLEALKKDPFDEKAKDDVLWSARTIIQSTVALLQLSDNYDIRKTVNACKACETEQGKFLKADMATLNEPVRQLVYETVNLAKLVQDRINYIVDPMLQRKLEECNAVVRGKVEPLIHAHVAVLGAPADEGLKKARDELASELSKVYKKIISLAKLSSQEMFSGIDLNLNPLDDDDKFKEIQPVEVSLADGCRRIMEMAGNQATAKQMNAVVRDADNAVLKEIDKAKKAIAEETDPEKRKVLEAALGNLEKQRRNLKEAAEAYAANPTPENRKKLAEIAMWLDDAGTKMQQAIEMPDHLDRAANLVQVCLAQLANAVRFEGQPEALAAAKAVNAALQDQVNLAKLKAEKDPKRQRALNQAMQGQQGVLRGLLGSTKALVDGRDGPNGPKLWEGFNVASDDLAAYSQRIADVSDPARAAQMFQTPDEVLQNAIARVNEDLAKLQKGGPDSAEALKAAAASLNAVMGLGKQRKGKKANAICSAMAGTLGGMLKTGRDYLKDPSNYAALDRDCDAIKNHQADLMRECVPVPERMVDMCADLNDHAAQLIRALEDNNERQAHISHADVNRDLQACIDAIERTPADGDKRALLNKLKEAQQRVMDDLAPAVKRALEKPGDRKALERVEELLEEARRNALATADAVVEDLEYAAVAGAARTNSAMRTLSHAMNTGDEEAIDTARRNAEGKTRRQAILADLLALHTQDDKYKTSLLDASRDLSDILRDLFGATGAALGGDEKQLNELLDDSREANKGIVSGVTDPVGRMEALGQRINNQIGSLSYPVDESQRMPLVGIVDGLEQQLLLAQVVEDRDPSKADALQRARAKAQEVLEKLKPAIIDCVADPNDRNAQNYLEDRMEDARRANSDLVEAAQPELLDRILSNIDASEREMASLDDCLRRGDQGTARVIAADIAARQQKQGELLKKAADQVGPKLSKPLGDHGLQSAKLGSNIQNAAESRIANSRDVPAATAYTRHINKQKKANQEIRDLIAKAKRGDDQEEEEKPKDDSRLWAGGQGGLHDAANKLRKGTRELKIDDSAKGRLYEQAQLIADAMARLAVAAQNDDKAGILHISKEIATATQTVVSIAKTIPAKPQDKEQIVSFALSAKGTGVQLKILSAVKASINGRDRTAEEQLVTCASGLAEQVMQAVKVAQAAELRV